METIGIEDIQDTKTSIIGDYASLLNDLLTGKSIIVGTDWLKEHDDILIDRICEWVEDNIMDFVNFEYGGHIDWSRTEFDKSFKEQLKKDLE